MSEETEGQTMSIQHRGMSVHALGTGGGPIVSTSRAGTSTAVTVDGATYVIDCGMGSIRNYRSACTWSDLRAIFLTHLHSDHIYDLGAFLVTGWEVPGECFSRPISVHGPGRTPGVPAFDANHAEQITQQLGDRVLTGTVDVVDAFLTRIFASDIAIRVADEGRSEPRSWIEPHDIIIPPSAGADPVTARHPVMEPFEVYQDEFVRVSAILVDHRLCYPAFAFRLDSEHGSVVISGDTAYSQNCILLARGADILLHEVIDLDAILATFPEGPTRDGIAEHLRESHTPHGDVGKVAREADVGHLVLHHIVPNTPGTVEAAKLVAAARKDFDGLVDVAEDGDTFTVSRREPKLVLSSDGQVRA